MMVPNKGDKQASSTPYVLPLQTFFTVCFVKHRSKNVPFAR